MLKPELWTANAAPFTVVAPPSAPAPFQPWAARLLPDFAEDVAEIDEDVVPDPVNLVDPEEVAVGAFARGYEEGCRAMEEEIAVERTALHALAATLAGLRPEPPAALAALIAETVGRLVRQVVGEVEIDAALLRSRAERAAAIVADETRPVRMRLCPADRDRLADAALAIDLVADSALAPGAILVETADGWIEDGPAAALDRLSRQLDRLGVAR